MNSYNYSYNVLINRLEAFAAGHFLIKRFTHGQIDLADQLQDDQYPFMHVTPDTITPVQGGMQFGFHIMFADIPRDKEYKAEYQREVISDCIRLGQDLVAEVKNGLQLFGFDVQLVNDVTFEPFMEEQKNTVTGVAFTIKLEVPWDWSACDIPAVWSVGGASGSGGSGVGYGITLQTNGVDNVVQTLLNLEAGTNMTITDNGNGTITFDAAGGGGGGGSPYVSTEFNVNHTTAQGNQYVIGDRVWYNGNVYACIANNDAILPTNTSYWTLQSAGYRLRQNPVDWNASTGDYQILNKPTIPAAQVNSDWNAVSGVSEILNKPTIPVNLDDLADVDATSPATGDVISWNGTVWRKGRIPLVNLSDVNITSPSNGQVITWDTATSRWIVTTPAAGGSGTVTSVGLTVPSPANAAFTVTGSPVTTSGTLAIGANGTSSQYVDGTGALQTMPTGLPPSGAAGGDLQGTYPNPVVHQIHGIEMQSGTPTAGDVWLYEGAPAKWQHQPLPASHVTNDSSVTGSKVKDALNHLNTTKVESNAAITGATATKITYDSKGLVTSGTTLAAGDMPTGIDAANIGTGAVSNTEFGYLDGVTSAIQTQLNNKKDTVTYGNVYAVTVGASTTVYAAVSGLTTFNATETNRHFAVPVAGTLKNLYVKMSGTQSATGTLVITMRNNATSSSVAVTVANADGASPTKSDNTNTLAINAGDLLAIQLINNATVASASVVSISFVIERS